MINCEISMINEKQENQIKKSKSMKKQKVAEQSR